MKSKFNDSPDTILSDLKTPAIRIAIIAGMNTHRFSRHSFGIVLVATVMLNVISLVNSSAQGPVTASGKPAEGQLAPFLGKPVFDKQFVFQGGDSNVREPYLAIALDGTLLAVRNNLGASPA